MHIKPPPMGILLFRRFRFYRMGGSVMSEKMTAEQLKQVGENCSQYQAERRGTQATMGVSGQSEVSCTTCKNWSGKKCVIDAFDNVAVNLGILPEED